MWAVHHIISPTSPGELSMPFFSLPTLTFLTFLLSFPARNLHFIQYKTQQPRRLESRGGHVKVDISQLFHVNYTQCVCVWVCEDEWKNLLAFAWWLRWRICLPPLAFFPLMAKLWSSWNWANGAVVAVICWTHFAQLNLNENVDCRLTQATQVFSLVITFFPLISVRKVSCCCWYIVELAWGRMSTRVRAQKVLII